MQKCANNIPSVNHKGFGRVCTGQQPKGFTPRGRNVEFPKGQAGQNTRLSRNKQVIDFHTLLFYYKINLSYTLSHFEGQHYKFTLRECGYKKWEGENHYPNKNPIVILSSFFFF